ncbi:hypothetical protein HY972_00125 [Candidatus Kaiserbacteria bacterium]|nr:hypothetical protein [Candidatus Kaiserbacteria bacterium]
MDKPKTTPKDFFLWAGAMVAFYWSVIAFIFLIFDYISYALPNPLAYYPSDPYQSGISSEMASIIVLLPLALVLLRIIRKDIVRDPSRKEIWVRRWALILILFVAGVAMAGDFITLLTSFLSGEDMTLAFLLKVLVVFLVAGGVFLHFIADFRGYWDLFPKRKNTVVGGVAILAVVSIVSGFFIVGTPAAARLARFDAQKVSDLQNIQSQVITYWQAKQKLPATLGDLSNSLAYGPLPVDAQSGQSYEYQAVRTFSFKLCAVFNAESRTIQGMPAVPRAISPIDNKPVADNWQHGVGRVCFDRTIDPSFYPPLSK